LIYKNINKRIIVQVKVEGRNNQVNLSFVQILSSFKNEKKLIANKFVIANIYSEPS